MAGILTKKEIFRDIDYRFKAHPETGGLAIVRNEEAIKQEVRNLLFTNKYEKLFQPKIYSNLLASLFENFDPITVEVIKSSIKDVITNYAPRAQLINITLFDRLDAHNAIEVSVTIKPLNFQNPVKIDFFLERIR